MNIAKELDRKIEKKQQEIVDLERTLGEAKAYLQALQDTRRLLPRASVAASLVFTLRPGSDVAKVREILQKEGTPIHIDDLLRRLGKEVTKKTKVSLGGSLSTYVRDRKIFIKTGPNTFGLVEFEGEEAAKSPPDDFGIIPMAEGNN